METEKSFKCARKLPLIKPSPLMYGVACGAQNLAVLPTRQCYLSLSQIARKICQCAIREFKFRVLLDFTYACFLMKVALYSINFTYTLDASVFAFDTYGFSCSINGAVLTCTFSA